MIAAYDKDLSWMQNLNDDIKQTIYRKDNILPTNENEIHIEPNFGRCVHTFLIQNIKQNSNANNQFNG